MPRTLVLPTLSDSEGELFISISPRITKTYELFDIIVIGLLSRSTRGR
jgi:hypothetical protein